MVNRKYKYRFKTKQEFINEFGENWRIDQHVYFPRAMDCKFGEIFYINEEIDNDFLNGNINKTIQINTAIFYDYGYDCDDGDDIICEYVDISDDLNDNNIICEHDDYNVNIQHLIKIINIPLYKPKKII